MCQIRAPPESWRFHTQTDQSLHINSKRAAHPDRCTAHFVFSLHERKANHMIPDEPFNFNGYGALTNLDDHEVRLRHLLGQGAILTPQDDRHRLLVCPICKRPWYKGARQEHPRLTPEQLAFLGEALHTDVSALHLLPRVICTICSTVYLGGMFSVEAYPHNRGYRFLWESASPRRIRLLAMVCRSEGLSLDLLVQMSPTTCTEPMCDTRAVLAWLETCPFPETMRAYTDEQRQHLARRCPPGSAPDGSVHQWSGYTWDDTCPSLGGDVLVSLAVTLQPLAPSPFVSLLIGWHVLARAMRTVL